MTHQEILKKLDKALAALRNCENSGHGGVFPSPITAAMVLGELRGELAASMGQGQDDPPGYGTAGWADRFVDSTRRDPGALRSSGDTAGVVEVDQPVGDGAEQHEMAAMTA